MSVYRTPNGKAWRAFLKYRGHRDSRTFTRRHDAVRWLTEQRAEIDRGSWLDPSRGQVHTGELFERWLATRDVEGSTRRNDRAIWHAYCVGRFGRIPVASISAAMVKEWVAGLRTRSGVAAPRTKRDALRVLRGVLAYAVEDGRIARNPAVGIRVPGTKGTPGVALSLAELRTFVAALHPPHHEVALVLALAGLRWSELAALDERDVVRDDDGRLFLAIRRRRVLDEEGKRVTLPGTKGGRGITRMVPVLPELVPIVEQHRTGRPDLPLFPSPQGARLDSRNWRRDAGWKAACDLVDKPGLRPHDLRHTAATAWLRITGDVKAVQSLLGHATASMTLDLYSHLLNDTLTRAADLMAEGLAGTLQLPESGQTEQGRGPVQEPEGS
ncbi:tyrosine-type recombinase/integrase [Pedococcus sp. NPDC057267]|uniref:tyrosine-type recombinase/integrase n=1 Tax=Pedococcus sp. NPDC057267 TaxID=3346077 RepID=UPI00362E6645